ncbi:hypothetical protein LZZ85_07490 [Terrimonas sp. NA20]|uniref:Uncharacterized protein n=1 Tax=Terrimonas ginsenosidimutans TaxID=2908004 RepID=A0ABS9KP58_9BACT|nr:hypothetical protein [Terrimonas ginsenosidimutans]MCG2614119.1 hypothetical protein [Terrimonas ginsenosidimutans]
MKMQICALQQTDHPFLPPKPLDFISDLIQIYRADDDVSGIGEIKVRVKESWLYLKSKGFLQDQPYWGQNRIGYADNVIVIGKNTLLFASSRSNTARTYLRKIPTIMLSRAHTGSLKNNLRIK